MSVTLNDVTLLDKCHTGKAGFFAWKFTFVIGNYDGLEQFCYIWNGIRTEGNGVG